MDPLAPYVYDAGADPRTIREIACTFTGMVLPGTDIEVCCLDVQHEGPVTRIFFEVINAENKRALRNGYLKLQRQTP